MEFEKLAIESLGELFAKYNFHIAEQRRDYVRFESNGVAIRVVRDWRDNSNSLSITISNSSSIILTEDILTHLFNFDLKVDQVAPNVFFRNFALFFKKEGKSVLEKNVDILQTVQAYSKKVNAEYNMELINSQLREAADEAWNENDFKKFVTIIDKIGLQNLPTSYGLKYKVAQKKQA